ncbi:MAG: hypothetical protein WC362_00905 [Methanoregula sp.]|jgi:hypothetical protein
MGTLRTTEDALTVLGVIVIILGILVLVYGVLIFLSPGEGGTRQGGMLHSFASNSGDLMRPVGPAYVFSAVNGTPAGVSVRYPHPDSGRMGAAEMTVALFIGDMGGVDFDTVRVVWVSGGIAETIPRQDSRPLVCPGWTIAGKSNMLPLKTADSDNILEPNEQFEIFVCPANTTAPYQQFSLTIIPPGNTSPPIVSATVPPLVQPITRLS